MTLPILGKSSRVQAHLEMLWDAETDEGVYLAEYSLGENSGSRLMCKCSRSEMIPFLESQYEASKKIKQGSFSIGLGDMNFQAKNCLYETLPLTPKYDRPILSELLTGKFKQQIKSEELDIALSSELYVVNGRSTIYLEGSISDENINFIGVGKKHRLRSIKTLDGKLLYPPHSSPEWKKSLVSTGYFTGSIIPSSSNRLHQTVFGENKYLDEGKDVGIVISIDENLKGTENGVSIKGAVEVMVDKGKDTTIQVQLPFYKPSKILLVKTKDNFSLNRNDEVENEGSLSIGDSDGKKWSTIRLTKFNLSSQEQTVVATVQNDEQQLIQEIELAEKEALYMEMVTILPESMYIPVDVALDRPILNTLKVNELKLQHYEIHSNNNSDNAAKASIKFELFAPVNTSLSVSELQVLGNDEHVLEVNHKISRDEIWGNDSLLECEIDISIEKLPRDVDFIGITGKLNIDDGSYPPSGDITVLPFQETISLSGGKGFSRSTLNPLTLNAYSVLWSNIDYLFTRQGITANFRVPKEKDVTFLNVLTEKSKVLSLKDGVQNDLVTKHKSAFSDRLQYLKYSTKRYAFDHKNDVNRENQLESYADRTKQPVSFSIIQYVEPATNVMQGEVEVALLGHKSNEVPKRKSYDFAAVPRQIDLELGDEILTFTNGSWGESDKDGNSFIKYGKYDYSDKIHISSIKVYDAAGQLVSIADGKDYGNLNLDSRFIVINKTHSGPTKITIEYYELEEYTRRYPIEVSFDLE